MSEIYNMKLHETYDDPVTNAHIIRVPGGWIYNYAFRKISMFVAYNDEFDEERKIAQLNRLAAEQQMQTASIRASMEAQLRSDALYREASSISGVSSSFIPPDIVSPTKGFFGSLLK